MGYLTNLLLVSAGLLLVSGSPAPKGYLAPKGYPAPKGYSRRRDNHKGNDYAAQGEDYVFDDIGKWLSDLARPVIDRAVNTAIKKVFDQGIERVVKDLPNLIEGAVPGLTDKANKVIQHASEQFKKDHR